MRVLILLLAAMPLWGGYSYQRTITLGGAGVIPASQSDFTVLVCANGSGACNTSVAGLNQSGGGAHVTNASGFDIVFSATVCTAPTLMNWEMDKYTASTGEMYAWVLVTSLAPSGVFYLCYGNGAISTFQGGATGTAWDANYKGVWHLPDGTTLTANDSSAAGQNGTLAGTVGTPSATTGQIDGGAVFASANKQYVQLPNASTFTIPTTAATLSSWFKVTGTTPSQVVFFGVAASTTGMGLRFSSSTDGKMYANFKNGSNSLTQLASTGTVNDGAWHYAAFTISGSTASLYIDNNAATTAATVSDANTFAWAATPACIGTIDGGTGFNYNGSLDDVKFSNTARSANWVKTEYNNQSSPSTFLAIAAEVTTCIPSLGILGAGCQ